jgi:hypothetical protein
MTAVVYDLAVVRGAIGAARPMSQAEIDAEVAAIRAELVRPLQRLAVLREAGAHLTSFGPDTLWHEACLRWFGDLADLRLTGTKAAIAEREALIWSMREAGDSTRVIRDRLGVGASAVADALAKHDPAPDTIIATDGRVLSARTGRRAPEPVTGPKWRRAAALLRQAPDGLTIASLAKAGGWSEGSASGLLSDLLRRGLAVRSEDRRDGMRVHRAVES